MGYALRLSLLAVLFFIGCGSPKIERIQEETPLGGGEKNIEEEAQTPMPKLRLEDIPPTPDRKSTRLNSSHRSLSRMPSSA